MVNEEMDKFTEKWKSKLETYFPEVNGLKQLAKLNSQSMLPQIIITALLIGMGRTLFGKGDDPTVFVFLFTLFIICLPILLLTLKEYIVGFSSNRNSLILFKIGIFESFSMEIYEFPIKVISKLEFNTTQIEFIDSKGNEWVLKADLFFNRSRLLSIREEFEAHSKIGANVSSSQQTEIPNIENVSLITGQRQIIEPLDNETIIPVTSNLIIESEASVMLSPPILETHPPEGEGYIAPIEEPHLKTESNAPINFTPVIDLEAVFHNFTTSIKNFFSKIAAFVSRFSFHNEVRENLREKKRAVLWISALLGLALVTYLLFGPIQNMYFDNKLGNPSEVEGKNAIEYFVSQGTKVTPSMLEILSSNAKPAKKMNALFVLEQLDSLGGVPYEAISSLLDSKETQLALLNFLAVHPFDEKSIGKKISHLIRQDSTKEHAINAYAVLSLFAQNQSADLFPIFYECASDLTSVIRSKCLKLVNEYPYNLEYTERLNQLNLNAIGEGDRETRIEALSYIVKQFSGNNQFLDWSKSNKIKYFSNILNSSIQANDQELNLKLISVWNVNTSFYNDKTLQTGELLSRIKDSGQVASVIESVNTQGARNSLLFDFAFQSFSKDNQHHNSIIKSYLNGDKKSFIDWIKKSDFVNTSIGLGKTVDLIYFLNNGEKEYYNLAIHIRKVQLFSSLENIHQNAVNEIISLYEEGKNSHLDSKLTEKESENNSVFEKINIDRTKIEKLSSQLEKILVKNAKFRKGPGKSFDAFNLNLFFPSENRYRKTDFIPEGRQVIITAKSVFQEEINGSIDYWYFCKISLGANEETDSRTGWIFGSLIGK